MRNEASEWFESLPHYTKQRIIQHFGQFPAVEGSLFSHTDGPVWIWWLIAILSSPTDPQGQVAIISMSSLIDRLQAVHRILDKVRRRTPAE